jgi:hypothetical protein
VEIFNSIFEKEITLLEIGVSKGSSIAAWSDLFQNSKVVGVDVDLSQCRPDLLERIKSNSRCHLIEGNASLSTILGKLQEHAPFDVIIDDGSHYSSDVIKAYELLFYNMLKPNGYYIIEDLNCSYMPGNGLAFRILNKLLGGDRNHQQRALAEQICNALKLPGSGVIGDHKQFATMKYFKEIADDINLHGKNIGGRNNIAEYLKQTNNKNEKYVEWIQFRRELIIIKKRNIE